MASPTTQGSGDAVATIILRWAVAILTSGLLSIFLLRRAVRAEASLDAEKRARALLEAELAAARDELAARGCERRLLALAKRDGAAPAEEPQRRSSGLIAGGRVVTLRLKLRASRRPR